MATVTIHIEGGDELASKMVRFKDGLPRQLRAGFYKAGMLLTADETRKLAGPSHSRFPGNANPYPGRVSGQLSKIQQNIVSTAGGLQLRVGPGSFAARYAPIQFLGGTITQRVTRRQQIFLGLTKGIWKAVGSVLTIKIPPRDPRPDVIRDKGDAALDAVQKTVMEGWR